MTYNYVLDSSAWIEYFGGSPKIQNIKKIIEEGSIATSILAIAELADKYEREKRLFEERLSFITTMATILPLSITIAKNAGQLKNNIRSKNNKFGLIDALHLATAYEYHAQFITSDNDFKGLDNVLLI